MRNESWRSWLLGIVVGVGTGVLVSAAGIIALLALGAAVLAMGFVATRSLAVLSGGFLGLGALWLAAVARGLADCPAPNCTSVDLGSFPAVTASVIIVGVLLGIAAWRRAAAQR